MPVFLQGPSIFQYLWQILLFGLQIRIPANVFLADPNAWYSRLASDLGESALDVGTII